MSFLQNSFFFLKLLCTWEKNFRIWISKIPWESQCTSNTIFLHIRNFEKWRINPNLMHNDNVYIFLVLQNTSCRTQITNSLIIFIEPNVESALAYPSRSVIRNNCWHHDVNIFGWDFFFLLFLPLPKFVAFIGGYDELKIIFLLQIQIAISFKYK